MEFVEKVSEALLKTNFSNIRFCAIDFETTGFNPKTDEIIEIGAVEFCNFQIGRTFHTLIQPNKRVSLEVTKITGINNDMLMSEPTIDEVRPSFINFIKGATLVEHSRGVFDLRFLKNKFKVDTPNYYINTLEMSKRLFRFEKKHDLESVCKRLNLKLGEHHHALDDAKATACVLMEFLKMLEKKGYHRLNDLYRLKGVLKWL
jgi:DNA polymerase-3 subunit alpha (Gram-positive type)